MNKKVLGILSIVIGVILIAGGVYAFSQNDNNDENQSFTSSESTETMEKTEVIEKSDTSDPGTSNSSSGAGSYVTLADYNSNPDAYAGTRAVYFFHASWCPVCQGIDDEIMSEPSKIPSGVTLIKTDYDQNTDLRQMYGVTYQYTFVEVDSDGNQTNKFSASSLDKVISGLNG